MSIKAPGYGKRGAKGDAGPQGAASTVPGPTGATGATGAAGSNASATPLATANPLALGTAAVGTSAKAAREDHVHPASGTLIPLGNVTVTETLLISLAVGMKRMTLPLAGVAVGDKLQVIPNGTPTTGCEAVNAYPASAGNVAIGYYTPLLGIGATYAIPVSVYRIAP